MGIKGIQHFDSLEQALSRGYTIYERHPDKYLLRIYVNGKWAFAFCNLEIV